MAFPTTASKVVTPVTVNLPPGATTSTGATGTATIFVNTDPLTVRIVTSVQRRTTERLFPVLIEFSSAGLGFTQAAIRITGGNISCFSSVDQGVGRIYQVLVQTPKTAHLEISVPAGVVRDNYGNANRASNVLKVDVRDVTLQARAVWATSTATFGATALLSGATSALVAYTSRAHFSPPGLTGYFSAQPLQPGSATPVVGTHPGRNLLGTLFHMQLFALAERLAVPLPPLFRDSARGMRWTLFQVPLPADTELFDSLNIARESDGAADTANCAELQQRFLSLVARLGLLETPLNSSALLPDFAGGAAQTDDRNSIEAPLHGERGCVGGGDCETKSGNSLPLHRPNRGLKGIETRSREKPVTKPVSLHLNDGELLYKTNPDDLGLHHRFKSDRGEERIAYEGESIIYEGHESLTKRVRHSPSQALEYSLGLHSDWYDEPRPKRVLLSESDVTEGQWRISDGKGRSAMSPHGFSPSQALEYANSFHSDWQIEPVERDQNRALPDDTSAADVDGPYDTSAADVDGPDDLMITQALRQWSRDPVTIRSAGAVKRTVEEVPRVPEWADVITYQRRSLLQAPAATQVPELTPVEFSYLQQWTAGFLSARVYHPGGHSEFRQFWRAVIWAVVFLIALTFLHVAVFATWRSRTKAVTPGALFLPRFELFLVAVTVAGVANASTVTIAGNSAWGLGLGLAFLILWPVLFTGWILLFLWFRVIRGERVGYFLASEDRDTEPARGRFQRLLSRRRPRTGYWVSVQPGETKFLSRWGSLFEDTRGLAVVSGPESAPYFPSGAGTGTVTGSLTGTPQKPANEDDASRQVSSSELRASRARISYRAIELVRMIAYAVLLGAFGRSQRSLGQVVALLAVSIAQIVLLLLLRPFISRRLQLVETVSCLCEVGIFVCALVFLKAANGVSQAGMGWVMVALFLVSLGVQLISQLVALFQQLSGVRRPPSSSSGSAPGTVNRADDTEWATPEPSRRPSRGEGEFFGSPAETFSEPGSPEMPLRTNRTARQISFE